MNKKTRAFTVVEITLAVTIIAVIAILTIGNKENAEARRIKKNKAVSHSFYSNILTVYQKALLKKDYKGSATNVAGTNAKKKSENVRNLLLEYLDGEKSDCTNIKNIAKSTKSKSFVNDNMACFTTPSKIMGAVYFDTKCTNSYSIK